MKRMFIIGLAAVLLVCMTASCEVDGGTNGGSNIPTEVEVTPLSSTAISIRWKGIANAEGYTIYRVSDSGEEVKIPLEGYESDYTDTNLLPATYYSYRISATKGGTEGPRTQAIRKTTLKIGQMVPDTVTGVTAVPGDDGITITWDPQSGVTIYTLERRADENDEWTPLPEVSGSTTKYLDPNRPAGTYYYRVAASNSYGPGPWSAPCEVTVKTTSSDPDSNPNPDPGPDTPPGALAAPVGLSVTAQTQNSISLSWQVVSGAEGYRVSRSGSSDPKTTTSTSYTDTGLTPNTTYYYQVTAYNGQNESSPAATSGTTTTVSGDGTIPLPPAKPAGLVVSSAGSGSVSLSWNGVANANSYEVYRANSKDGTAAKIGTVTGTSYTDSTVGAGALYYYSVRAVNSSGSSPSSDKAFACAASHYSLPTYSSSNLMSLSGGAKHYYRLAVTAGQGVTITWENGSSQDADYYVRCSAWQNDGTQIFNNDRGGYTSPKVFTAAMSGYITVEIANASGSTSYDYRVYYY